MKKNTKTFSKKSLILFGTAAVLLLGSTIGSSRAALTYYSENYAMTAQISKIGVSLVENGDVVSHRDYTTGSEWSESEGVLLESLINEDEKITLGKKYEEVLAVQNSGSIDAFVRVILKKNWQNQEGEVDRTLSPELIDLNVLEGNGWIIDPAASTNERVVLYYKNALAAGATTPAITDTICIDSNVGKKVTETVLQDQNGYQTITTTYDYDGYSFSVTAEVNAVQTHNAKDAIKSAWGVDVNVSADNRAISLR